MFPNCFQEEKGVFITYTASEKLWGKYYKKFENSIKTENKTIYHYTSSDSKCKILSNKCIWFSNANYLNDESERTYIYRLLKRRVEKHKLNDSFKKEVLEICAIMESDKDNFVIEHKTDDFLFYLRVQPFTIYMKTRSTTTSLV